MELSGLIARADHSGVAAVLDDLVQLGGVNLQFTSVVHVEGGQPSQSLIIRIGVHDQQINRRVALPLVVDQPPAEHQCMHPWRPFAMISPEEDGSLEFNEFEVGMKCRVR